ncbi:MAG: trypsin-like peptidase domain-containing protein [Anaerolineae bacterium]|nr:trypsin-like peptidase domain-containing protein [Anaerolineae bacterium]
MQRRFSVFFVLMALVAVLLTGCGTVTQTVGQNILDQVAEVLPTIAPSAQAPATSDAELQTTAQTDPAATATPAADLSLDTADEAQVVQPVPVAPTTQEETYIELYKRVNPAVVSVYMTSGSGSGFVIDPDGYIVTNNHVIAEGGPITVYFSNGEVKDATLVGTDTQADIALLKVDAAPGELTAVPLGDSDALEVGQSVVAIGSPFGLDNTMTTGIVSALSRSMPADETGLTGTYTIPNVIQTDAAINPGNSGGPLFNLAGEVIGVNTAIESPVRANSGVGFAVPSNVVKVVIAQLREGGAVKYPWLGIAGGTLTADMAEEMGLARTTRGVIVSEVTAGGPAATAGLQGGDATTGLGGDIIIGINDLTVTTFDDLLGYIVQETTIGQTVTLTVLRDGQQVTVPVTLGERPAAVEEPQLQQEFPQP